MGACSRLYHLSVLLTPLLAGDASGEEPAVVAPTYELEELPAELQVTIKLPKRIKKLDDVELTVDR